MNIYVYCEGQTEESFVKNYLAKFFEQKEIYLYPIICRTKEGPSGISKGGLTDYNKAVREIKKLCNQHPHEIVTSCIDYYGLENLPTINNDGTDKYSLISDYEQKFYEDVGCKNFIPNISLHEFESILFTDPNQFEYLSHDAVIVFKKILKEFNNNPEFINSGKITAPSKRILKEIPQYSKVLDSNIIIKNLSLNDICAKCKHFSDWIQKLEGK